MFCPNCGTQNDSAATPCKKCGFKLSGISAPKFKGTMVLNSDQTVQELIEEHRKKQAEGGANDKCRRASEPQPPSSGSAPPPGSFPGTPRGPVLQPPRAAAGARRRMGGTMLGVAPQGGGLLPPDAAARPAPTEPSRKGPPPPREDPAGAEPPVSSGPTDALAGTTELPVVERALAANPAPEGVDATRGAEPVPPADAGGVAEKAAEPARAERAVAVTAPLPQRAASLDSQRPAPPRLGALDVVLIIITFGLYGIVLWMRQRKPNA